MGTDIDDDFLADVGLADLPIAERARFRAFVGGRLAERVGTRMFDLMSAEQVDEFERRLELSEDVARRYLDEVVPTRGQIVEAEVERLKAEIRPVAPQILAAAAD